MKHRTVPGSEDVPGREFVYIEIFDGEQFADIVRSAMTSDAVAIPTPSSGGAIEHKVQAKLEDGTTLLAVSYKGDLAGWRDRFIELSRLQNRKIGVVRNNKVVFSPDEEVALEDLYFEFEE